MRRAAWLAIVLLLTACQAAPRPPVVIARGSPPVASAARVAPAPEPSAAESFHFLNVDLGWVRFGERLAKTTDGGLSWAFEEVPVTAAPGTMSFRSETSGLALGDGLWRTDDGGNSWLGLRKVGPFHSSLAFAPGGAGWLLNGDLPDSQCTRQSFTLELTDDYGDHWQALPASGIGPQGCKGSMSFLDPSDGWIVAQGPGAPAVVYRTRDGGRSWAGTRLTPALGPETVGYDVQGPYMSSPVAGVLFVRGCCTDSPAVVMRTYDGAGWQVAGPAPGNGIFTVLGRSLWVSDFKSPAGLWRSDDGGRSWIDLRPSFPGLAANTHLRQLQFFNAATGYAIAGGAVWRTDDGGRSWRSLSIA